MKRELDLKNAFRQSPARCRQALMQAARSVKEDEPVKRFTLRTLLIAALIMIALMAAALAAAGGGLVDWFQSVYGAVLPPRAQEILSATQTAELEAGPVTFTVNELLCDGKIACLTLQAQAKGEGIVYADGEEITDPIGEHLAMRLDHPQITGETSYQEAAKITGLPLYCASAWLETESYDLIETELMDHMRLDSGGVLLVRMLYLKETLTGSALPVKVRVKTQETELAAQELKAVRQGEAVTEANLAINGVSAEKQYAPEKAARLSEQFIHTGVTARQTCAGVYLYIKAQPDAPMTLEEMRHMPFEWNVLNGKGEPYPGGISLTCELLNGQGLRFPADRPANEVKVTAFTYMLIYRLPEVMPVWVSGLQLLS